MTPRTPLLPLPTLTALLLTLALAAAPHAVRQPVWLLVLALTCGAWRYLIARRGDALPPAWLRTLLTIAAATGIFGSYGTLFGRDAGSALLLAMTALKLLEMHRRRDVHVLLYLGYFLIATQFLYDQSLPMLLYLAATSWAMTVMLMTAHQARPPAEPLRYAGHAAALLLQALPVMLVLFVLFPRIAGPLWKLPDDGASASTGLSDTMAPGDITQLSRSDEVAFRVEFAGEPPPAEVRYWRGPVLADYDGRTWRRAAAPGHVPQIEPRGGWIDYSVLLEPHNQRWLFALDVPLTAPTDARWDQTLTLQAAADVDERRRYVVRSAPSYRLDAALPSHARAQYLALPTHAHPRAQTLARGWQDQGLADHAVVDAAMTFFRSQPFVYTLTPPALPQDAVDQFLFETRRGFCEHYASAFTVLMRAAGIPARVVTGYLGGEINPLGDYMIVRQSDAHAWAEVWLEGQGWVRLDPTGWVAPHRVERGLADAVPADEPVPLLARSGGLLKKLNLQWDAINNGWNRWVLGYGPDLQRQLLARAGLDGWQHVAAALATTVSLLLGVTALFLLRERSGPRDPLLADYARFCRKLGRRGLPRRPSEAPQAYATRVAAARPELAQEVEAITRLYTRLRYGPTPADARARRSLRRRIRVFSP